MKQFSTVCIFVGLLGTFSGCDQKRSDQGTPQAMETMPVDEDLVISSESRGESGMTIRVAETEVEWEAKISDVQAVLDSAAAEFVKFFPDRRMESITVYPKGGPIVFYERGTGGEYTVKLNTGKTFWSQYTFQLAHELAHIFSNYRLDKNPNGWFEESLCEAASLYVLRAMGQTWAESPPFENWRSYSGSLGDYARKRIDEANLLARQPLADWFLEKETVLRASSTQRELNNVVAVKLLPLFEETPEAWESIAWLNVEESFPDDTFEEYLARWHYYVPERYREFVEKVATEFGITIE